MAELYIVAADFSDGKEVKWERLSRGAARESVIAVVQNPAVRSVTMRPMAAHESDPGAAGSNLMKGRHSL